MRAVERAAARAVERAMRVVEQICTRAVERAPLAVEAIWSTFDPSLILIQI